MLRKPIRLDIPLGDLVYRVYMVLEVVHEQLFIVVDGFQSEYPKETQFFLFCIEAIDIRDVAQVVRG